MASNTRMIIVPSKKPFDINITHPLKHFIQNTYTSNVDEYKLCVDSLNQLRNEALFRAVRQDKLNKLMRYHDQLAAIETKLPISENQIRVPFKWQDAFDRGSLLASKATFTFSSGLYERLCVLFNIGSSASEIASLQAFDTEEGLKTAAKYYQLAASAFNYIKDNTIITTRQDCTLDLYPETLNALIYIMLAQAQEVFYEKAVRDKMKDLTVSKIAAQCAEYYFDALKAIQIDYLKDLQKQWLSLITSKQALFQALTEYHRSLHEESEKNIGIQVARLTKSLESIKIAVDKGGKEGNMKNYAAQIQQAYDKAKKENDYVFHEKVPDYKTLPVIDRATLAKVQSPLKIPLSEEFKDLFVNLVPISVHQGLQTFNARRMEALNLEIGKLRQATDLLNSALATWNLPAAIEDVGGGSQLPQSLIDKSQGIKDRGGIMKIDQMMSDLPDLLNRNREILAETKRVLEDEENSDNELRTQMKDKWTRTPSRQLNESLFNEIKSYEQIIDNAVKANRIIDDKYSNYRDSIVLLSKSAHEIQQSLPAGNPVAALQNTHIVKDLRRLMNEVDGLRSVREVVESEIKNSDSDMIKAKLVNRLQSANGIDEHVIIQEELESLVGPLRKQVRENIQEQEKLLGFIEKANSEFCKEKVVNESSKIREEMLKNLAKAYDGYMELHNNLEEGSKFYNDLTPILVKFQSKVTDFVFARKTEKEDLMKEIQTNIARAPTPTRPAPPAPAQTTARPSSSSVTAPTVPTQQQQQQYQQPPNMNPNAPPPPYPVYPVNPNPYYPQMPNVYYPYSFVPQQQMPPQQPYGAYAPYPQQQPPVAPPRKNK